MSQDLKIANFCACFIDLLGQRDAQKGEGLLPTFESPEDEARFRKTIKKSVGTIRRLQKNASHFLEVYSDLSIRHELDEEAQASYDQTKTLKMKQQRWSDGLVLYTSMQGEAPMNAIWDIVCTAGSLCFLGLAEGNPLRGGLDISWGAELHDNELYGPIVANAYELEGSVAQYPRIVVGERVVEYLRAAVAQANLSDRVEAYNSQLAKLCSGMITIDLDGYHVVDYLGLGFKNAMFTEESSTHIFKEAYSFVLAQFEAFSSSKNSKLAIRYKRLLDYFEGRKQLHIGD